MQNPFQQLTLPARRAAATHITGAGISQPAVKVETGNILQGKRTVTGPGKVVQRFGVAVQTGGNLDVSGLPINGITFTGRPPDTYLSGGDPYGDKRHVIAVQLEYEAVRSLLVGKTIGQAATMLGTQPTTRDVEKAIKAKLASHKEERLYYQGSKTGNTQLEAVTQQGLSLMKQGRDGDGNIIDRGSFTEGVQLAYLGTLDLPPASARRGQEAALMASIRLHRKTFMTAYKVPEQYLPSESQALQLINTAGDDYADFAYNRAQALKSGAPAHQASSFGHFTLQGPRQQQQSLPSSSTPSTPYGLGPSYGGYPPQQQIFASPQPLRYTLPYPQQVRGGNIPSPFSGPTSNPLFTPQNIHSGGGLPGSFVPQHTTSSTSQQQQPPPYQQPLPQQQQGNTAPLGSIRTIQDLLN